MNTPGQRLRSRTAEAQHLMDQWKTASLIAGWRFPEDWFDPTVEEIAHAQAEGLPFADALARLGAARAYQGVGIRETMLDLGAFFEAAGSSVDHEIMRSLVEAWVEENTAVEAVSCTDPSTGLATLPHLERVLYELSTGPARDREGMCVARLHLALPALAQRPDWAALADLGQIFETEFTGVNTTAAIHRAFMYILMPFAGEGAPAALARFVERLQTDPRCGGGSITASMGPVPETSSQFSAMVADLRRPRRAPKP